MTAMPFLQVQSHLAIESDFVERLLSTSHSIVLFVDPTARIVLFNNYMRELCGHSYRDVEGQDWFDNFVPEPDRKRLREKFELSLHHDDLQTTVCPLVTRTGEVRQIEWGVTTVHGAGGELLGLIGVGQDVTEKLALREKLAESERLANIGMMASVLAHEVGNPLNAIYLQIQLLRRQVDRADRGALAPKVDAILSEITRLSMLLDDFRAYRDPSKVPLSVTDLTTVISQVTELLAGRAAEHDVTVVCEVESGLSQVLGNGNKLKQVFLNLCKNAIEAMRDGGTLQVHARCENDRVRIDVIDDGPGLPADVDVFAPFSTTKPSGMGLGLPLAREIVTAHSGSISCVSIPGHGTTFTVVLPKVELTANAPADERAHAPARVRLSSASSLA